MRWFWPLIIGCQEYAVEPTVGKGTAGPDIEVEPGSLVLGPTTETVTATFAVRNVGTESLDVSALVLESGELSFEVRTDAPFDVAPDEEQLVTVAFTPVGDLSYGRILVQSNDPDEPESPVDLQGLGQVPVLDIDPQYYTFGALCEDRVTLTLTNVGLEDLVITDIAYQAEEALSLIDDNVLPLTLSPGLFTEVDVAYQPTVASAALGTLLVTSNDPRGVVSAEQEAEGTSGPTTEQFIVEADPPIDILFALDKSCSMTDDRNNLGNAFESFINEIDLVTQDWQIGVVTDDNGCFEQGIITATTPDYQGVFINAVTGGSIFNEPDLTEALLELVDVSLRETGSTGCNAGFVRGNTVLHIVIVSDEPEQSGTDWSVWVANYQGGMSDPNLLVISGVVDVGGCESGADGYTQAVSATGGTLLDICDNDWDTFAAQLGGASAETLRTFLLSATPDPESIEVAVDGTTYAGGWHYDAARNAVVVDVDLPEGAEVEVTYISIGC